MISLEAQIAEVERELAQRAWRYPIQVVNGQLKQRDANHRRQAMLAVLATLNDLAKQFAERSKMVNREESQ